MVSTITSWLRTIFLLFYDKNYCKFERNNSIILAITTNRELLMDTEWMGRYRGLVASLVRHGNVAIRTQTNKKNIGGNIWLNDQQWQILEYLIENRDKIFNMNDVSYRLDIPQSTFSKTIKLLCEKGLVEKYQAVNNRKNIILRPTDYGLKLYDDFSIKDVEKDFKEFFSALESVSDKDLQAVARAIELLDNNILPDRREDIELKKLEDESALRS